MLAIKLHVLNIVMILLILSKFYRMAACQHRETCSSLSLFGLYLKVILTFKWAKVSVSSNLFLNCLIWVDPSWCKLIWPRLAVRVDPVWLYLPLTNLFPFRQTLHSVPFSKCPNPDKPSDGRMTPGSIKSLKKMMKKTLHMVNYDLYDKRLSPN